MASHKNGKFSKNHRNGKVKYEEIYLDGKLHSPDDDTPAYIEYDKNGDKLTEHWYINGLFHRESGPAYIEYDKNIPIKQIWYKNNVPHRIGGPAKIIHYNYDVYGGESTTREEWYENGVHHREGGPSIITYSDNAKNAEKWYINGSLYRDDGPADIEYYPDTGIVKRMQWCKKGIANNVDGLNLQWFGEDGSIKAAHYSLSAEKCNDQPSSYHYNENGSVKQVSYSDTDGRRARIDGPVMVEYYENGNVSYEDWSSTTFNNISNKHPAFISYYENGNIQYKRWKYMTGKRRNKLAEVLYDIDGNIIRELYFVGGNRNAQPLDRKDLVSYDKISVNDIVIDGKTLDVYIVVNFPDNPNEKYGYNHDNNQVVKLKKDRKYYINYNISEMSQNSLYGLVGLL